MSHPDHTTSCLLTELFGPDEIARRIDEDFDDLIVVDPYVTGTNNRRSDRDLAKMLELIDNLPISENGKEGSK